MLRTIVFSEFIYPSIYLFRIKLNCYIICLQIDYAVWVISPATTLRDGSPSSRITISEHFYSRCLASLRVFEIIFLLPNPPELFTFSAFVTSNRQDIQWNTLI